LNRRVAVISDVHGNWHALEAVLAAIDADKPDELWCLGDLVGYGPEPNRCCEAVAERARVCLVGNHDLLALGQARVDEEEFNPDAAAAARWTRSVLSDESRSFLETLEPQARIGDAELYHASPRDPVWEYVLTMEAVLASFALTELPLVLVGHSHVPLSISLVEDEIAGGVAGADQEAELSRGRWLLNPGSVGQPRDGDARAAYLLLDGDASARFRRVEYPVEKTQAEIRERGLPDALAERLAHGV
jgi:diadenosine tetraphosphatase ApaH/serine/threonine PP2A family protein phosphatase